VKLRGDPPSVDPPEQPLTDLRAGREDLRGTVRELTAVAAAVHHPFVRTFTADDPPADTRPAAA